MAFKRLQVIQSYDEPYDKNVLWLKNKTLRQYVNGEWVEIVGGNVENLSYIPLTEDFSNDFNNDFTI